MLEWGCQQCMGVKGKHDICHKGWTLHYVRTDISYLYLVSTRNHISDSKPSLNVIHLFCECHKPYLYILNVFCKIHHC